MLFSEVKFSHFLDPDTKMPIVGPKNLKGFVSCVYDNAFYLGGIAIYLKFEGGYRLVFPVRVSLRKKEFKIFFPIKRSIYDELLNLVTEQINVRERLA